MSNLDALEHLIDVQVRGHSDYFLFTVLPTQYITCLNIEWIHNTICFIFYASRQTHKA